MARPKKMVQVQVLRLSSVPYRGQRYNNLSKFVCSKTEAESMERHGWVKIVGDVNVAEIAEDRRRAAYDSPTEEAILREKAKKTAARVEARAEKHQEAVDAARREAEKGAKPSGPGSVRDEVRAARSEADAEIRAALAKQGQPRGRSLRTPPEKGERLPTISARRRVDATSDDDLQKQEEARSRAERAEAKANAQVEAARKRRAERSAGSATEEIQGLTGSAKGA